MSSSPPIPPGWEDVSSRTFPKVFGAGDLQYHRVSEPYKLLLQWNKDDMYLVQCGFPESDDNPTSCYVLWNPTSSDVCRITAPKSLVEIYEALEFLRSPLEEEYLTWVLAEPRSIDEIPEEHRTVQYQQRVDEINDTIREDLLSKKV